VVSLDPDVSSELLELLRTKLDTLEKVELVLAVRGAPGGSITIDALANELRLPPESVRSVVEQAMDAKLIVLEGSEVRLLTTPAEQELVTELDQVFSERRHQLLRLLSTIAIERVRRMAARAFADAFHFRSPKPKKGGDDG
jgi:hypothetical protein